MKIETRIERAARWAEAHKPEPMICIVERADGTQERVMLRELIDADGSFRQDGDGRILRFVDGASCKELDMFLNAITIEAERHGKQKESVEGSGEGSQPEAAKNRED